MQNKGRDTFFFHRSVCGICKHVIFSILRRRFGNKPRIIFHPLARLEKEYELAKNAKIMKRNELQDSFSGEQRTFQFTSNHQNNTMLFRDDEDYIYGVNTLALGTLRCKVRLLCYALMSNHIHLLLRGTYAECCNYYDWVARRLSGRLRERYGLSGVVRLNDVDVSAVTDVQMFRNEVAYQLRNPYKAHICSPLSYRWSAADVIFRQDLSLLRGEQIVGSMATRLLLRTRVRIPETWTHRDGCILNRCFVDYKYVEKQFPSSLEYFDHLRKYDLESILAQQHGLPESIRFSDSELMEKVHSICRNEYHVGSPHQLDRKTLLILARSVARRFGATKSQIARLLGLSSEILDELL